MPRAFGAQALGGIGLGGQAGFEIEAGRQVETGVRRSRELAMAVEAVAVGPEALRSWRIHVA